MFASKKFVEDRIAAVREHYGEDIDEVTDSINADIDHVGTQIASLHAIDKLLQGSDATLQKNLLLVTEILLKQRLHNADVMEHVAEMQAIVDDLQQQVDALTPKPVKVPVKPAVKKATPAPTKKV